MSVASTNLHATYVVVTIVSNEGSIIQKLGRIRNRDAPLERVRENDRTSPALCTGSGGACGARHGVMAMDAHGLGGISLRDGGHANQEDGRHSIKRAAECRRDQPMLSRRSVSHDFPSPPLSHRPQERLQLPPLRARIAVSQVHQLIGVGRIE